MSTAWPPEDLRRLTSSAGEAAPCPDGDHRMGVLLYDARETDRPQGVLDGV